MINGVDTYSYPTMMNSTVSQKSTAKRSTCVEEKRNDGSVTPKKNKESYNKVLNECEKNNDSISDGDEQTTFPEVNIFSKYSKYFKALNEHYTKVNEENKRFADPEKHIYDKYYNKKSQYYIKGLTQEERKICSTSEEAVLNGKAPSLNSHDPVIQKKFGGCNIFIMDMEGNAETREQLDDAIAQSLNENNIFIPEDADLQLTVDPYDFLIHVSGVDDELAKQIEDVLNKGKNGYNLYQHISLCNPVNYNVDEPVQYTSGDRGKMAVYHLVNRLTRYDIRNLKNENGKFYTPDGTDLWKELEQKYSELVANGETESFGLGEYYKDYTRIAQQGWGCGEDANLSIDYKNGSLYDVGTSYGYGPGQTEWQNNVRKWYKGIQDAYQKERKESLDSEDNTPTKRDMIIKETNQGNEMFDKTQDIFHALTPLNTTNLTELLSRLQKDGVLFPLSSKILNLHGEDKDIIPFDFKA